MFNTTDLINAGFEFGGSLFVSLSIFKILKDKLVRGVHWAATAFFFCMGVWNLYYYFHLTQYASWVAGILVTIANSVYLILLIYYTLREKKV